MDKFARFEVPADVLGDFVKEVSDRGLSASTSGPNHRSEYIVNVPYDKDVEDEVDDLKEYLDELIADMEEKEGDDNR